MIPEGREKEEQGEVTAVRGTGEVFLLRLFVAILPAYSRLTSSE